jgi:hypothetical protein
MYHEVDVVHTPFIIQIHHSKCLYSFALPVRALLSGFIYLSAAVFTTLLPLQNTTLQRFQETLGVGHQMGN